MPVVAGGVVAVGAGAGSAAVDFAGSSFRYSHETMSRLLKLLPMLMMVFIAVHVYVFRRHGLHTKEPHRAQYERSDVCAVSAAAVIVEAVVAFEVDCSFAPVR